MTFYAQAEYHGNIGDLGQGTTYQIEVAQDWRGRIYVAVCHGYEWKRYNHLPIVRYRTLAEFLTHWHNPVLEKVYRFVS